MAMINERSQVEKRLSGSWSLAVAKSFLVLRQEYMQHLSVSIRHFTPAGLCTNISPAVLTAIVWEGIEHQ